MAGSAKPRRRRAAAASLQYEHRPGSRSVREEKGSGKGSTLFGCLVFLSCTAVFVLLALSSGYWGDDTWKWAADEWPGGTYGFAVFMGALVPCVLVLFGKAISPLNRQFWKAHIARSIGRTLLAFACGAVMLQLVSLIFVAQDTGKWGRGVSSPPSWTFRTQPWLWAVGLVATVATAALWITVAMVLDGRRTRNGDPSPTSPTSPASPN
ncbi:hypothetical protein ACFU9Y_14610 [Streptomyces sp. NPDC057621]|uniref:hypothetical protein n=1 Tax=Streptomyces sp. NPDC057621 TaxID=3346186 RepID=UPI00369BD725